MSDEKDIPDSSSDVPQGDTPSEAVEAKDASKEAVVSEVSDDGDSKPSMETGEVVDRDEKKRLAALKKQEAAEAKKKTKDDLSDRLQQGRLAEKKKAKTKKVFRIGSGILGAGVLYMLYGFLFATYQAGITYGICRVYIETQVRFPTHLKFVGLEDFGDNVRVWYTRVDAFGGQRVETARCYYKWDEEVGSSVVDKILVNRREEPQYKIDSFNVVLPVVLQNLPDLSWPVPDSDKNLDNIEVDGIAARQPVL
jgi:hypothetical protein